MEIPKSDEAEMALLGSLFHNEHAIIDAAEILKEDDFYDLKNKAVWRACVSCFDKHRKVDIIHVNQWITDSGLSNSTGGSEYLVKVIEAVPSSIMAVECAHIVKSKSTERELICACKSIIEKIKEGGIETSDLLDIAHQKILSITVQGETKEVVSLYDTTQQLVDSLIADRPLVESIPTGFHGLDAIIGGFRPGEVTILAARPGVGKSMLSLNIAENISKSGYGVSIFSLEMESAQLAIRSLARYSSIDSERLQRGQLAGLEKELLKDALEKMNGMDIQVDDRAALTPQALRRSMRRQMMQRDCKLCIVDYLQLLNASDGKSQYEKISNLSKNMKETAKELSIPMLVVAQLNRASAYRDDGRPKMSDLRDSGCIEQDADCILLLYRKDSDDIMEDTPGEAEVIIAKQRQGRTGTVKLGWNASACRFVDEPESDMQF